MNDTIEKPILRTNKLVDIDTQNDIINRLAKEESQTSIAKSYQVSQNRISQINAINKTLVETKKQELLAELPTVVDTVKTDINTNKRLSQHIALDFNNITTENIALKNTLDKTNLNILKIAGISPSQMTVATLKFNQFNDNRQQTQVINSNVLDLFSSHAETLQDVDIQEDTIDSDN